MTERPMYLVLLADPAFTDKNLNLIHFAQENFKDQALNAVVVAPASDAAVAAYEQAGLNELDVLTYAQFSKVKVAQTAASISEFLTGQSHSVVLFGNDFGTTSIAKQVAAKLHEPLLTHINAVTAVDAGWQVQKRVYGGNLLQQLTLASDAPVLLTCDVAGVDETVSATTSAATVVKNQAVTDVVAADDVDYQALQTAVDQLEDAKVVVAGGRGMQGPDGFKLLQQLADRLHGSLGASRVAVDAGWVGKETMIGMTGKTVVPDVYIAVGISGAFQHTIGMDQSKYVIAINTDPDAAIFKLANYGIVGDGEAVVKQLLSKLKTPVTS
ncbi:electron transfer flavoprotein subunit alpha/FixB family protein [Lactiplantibacillus garii]|uniref:Electron transfer flavoprotein subunit alpha/FixB family protein n=1 Tax=Lactiplantibacillus garii TaxID=2306423 RepID=A0A426D8J1_9LACO|nr:electron transfer flavoprotein subunit alpha/FixB family protein [Lactiplantibacillus garii]RRK10910.1 electron transfer flavoprotein subunit alpha/FixB family protein [Lactiplantibacillus garii]